MPSDPKNPTEQDTQDLRPRQAVPLGMTLVDEGRLDDLEDIEAEYDSIWAFARRFPLLPSILQRIVDAAT